MPKKAMTIEDLAKMVKLGFDEVGKHLRDHDKRFDTIEERLDRVEVRLDRVEKKVDVIDDRVQRIELLLLTDHRKRIERLEDEVMKIKSHAR